MANIVIYTSGTLGDHLPFIALGHALKKSGHQVRMVINQAMHTYAERFGLETIALTDIERGPEQAKANAWAWNFWEVPSQSKQLANAGSSEPDRVIIQAKELIEICRNADLLISTSIRVLGYIVHNALEIPWLTVSMNPYSFWKPRTEKDRKGKRNSLLREYNLLKPVFSFAFKQLGIKNSVPPWSEGCLFSKNVILASSPYFSSPNLNQFQPHASIDMTGFWMYEDPSWKNWQPDKKLRDFCKRRPIVLSFSSQPLENSKQVLEVHVKAADKIKQPLLIQRGWADFSETDLPKGISSNNVLFADFLPHDWIFSQALCTIQHGGIGSIARALRQGCPMLIEPFGNDQLYNASRVSANLRAGAAMHPFKMTVDGLVKALREEVLTPECRRRVEALGDKMRSENGVKKACQLIDTYLERQQVTVPVSSNYAPYTPPLHACSKTHEMFVKKNRQTISEIPKIIHQTWKDTELPPALIDFQQTWQVNHPDWVYLLWTDSDNRKFIQKHYSWFLRIYDAYPEHIMRVDAVRYFILYHYGGVYVDLDFQCVKSLVPLLDGKQIVLGAEPDDHIEKHFPTIQPFPKLLCNAFMASQARHPFWDHLFKNLIAYRRAPDPLNATGPSFLSRVYESYPEQQAISIAANDLLYPITDNKTGSNYYINPVERGRISEKAYGIHHWSCTWWQKSRSERAEQAKVSVLLNGEKVETSSLLLLEEYRLQLPNKFDVPSVSCLLAAHGRIELVKRSIICFQRQTYPRKNLIVIDAEENDLLAEWIKALSDESITYHQVSAESRSGEDLLTAAAAHAKSDYVASWQADGIPDPRRLEVQMAAIHVFKTKACILERRQYCRPEEQQLFFSSRRIWEDSLVCEKTEFITDFSEHQNKNTGLFNHIVKNSRTVMVDFPQLYLTIFSPDMEESTDAWNEYARERTESFNSDVYEVMIQDIQNRLQLDLSPWIGPQPTFADSRCDRDIPAKQVPEKKHSSIPRIIHQTWKNADIPSDMKDFQRSWQQHHPDWMYCLWTDYDIREFIRIEYPWFLPIYDHYPEHIMRVDAVRYFIMFHYGGVYVDLDFQCLKPIDQLLAEKEVVFGLEPPAHLELPFVKMMELDQIICNAFLASVPGHPFWEHVFKQLIAYHRAKGPLDVAGPFLLTRSCISYPDKDAIALVPHDRIYPTSCDEPWGEMDPAKKAGITERAYAVHHWHGTWWKNNTATEKVGAVKVSLLVKGKQMAVSPIRFDHLQTILSQQTELPSISCLMVTKNRPLAARLSIQCFQQQTYKTRELIIIDDGEDDTLEKWTKELDDEHIVYVRLSAENKSLGELRNIAVERASGTYVTQWDDDDLSDPDRLRLQLSVIQLLRTDACFMERHQIWWPEKQRFAVSCSRIWEGSFVCLKSLLPRYPALPRGEDTPVIEQIFRHERAAVLDLPQLYTYIFHGANTFDSEHWDSHWSTATETYENDTYHNKIMELQKRFPFDLSEQIEQRKQVEQASAVPDVSCKEDRAKTPVKNNIAPMTDFPEILILVPVKDAENYLPNFYNNLKALTYPHDRISLAFLESDSVDNTYTAIERYLSQLQEEFANVKLFKRDYAYRSSLPRWEKSQQFQRRSIMAKSRNLLLSQALENEEWVLWIDVDVARWPNNVIEQLLAVQKDIVVPNCLSLQTGETFDYNTFKLKPGSDAIDWSPHITDGILQPPKGFWRFYLSDLRQHDCVEIDGVGGTMLLIRSDLHREGLIFPPYSYKYHIETEGLTLMAKDMGYQAWGLPNLEIYHP